MTRAYIAIKIERGGITVVTKSQIIFECRRPKEVLSYGRMPQRAQ
jgi:hypothetical protein